MTSQPVYLDCAASTPMEPEVIEFITHHFKNTWGNPHSRTHEYGSNARKLIDHAREQVAAVVDASAQEVIFTSGATESNNIVIQSVAHLAPPGEKVHVLASCIEHPSVLEPLNEIRRKGVEIELVDVLPSGRLDLEDFQRKLRSTTKLVSVMHVNSETGIKQPIEEICGIISDHGSIFHVDAAQGFGKDLRPLLSKRIDLISCSSHKIYGPKGIGALIGKRSAINKEVLHPLVHGGGQERNLRSGTAAAPLIAGFGLACELAIRDNPLREKACNKVWESLSNELDSVPAKVVGDHRYRIHCTANVSIQGIDSEAFMIATKDILSVSNGTACSSEKHHTSYVLARMGIADSAQFAIRFSWSHMTKGHEAAFGDAVQAVRKFLS